MGQAHKYVRHGDVSVPCDQAQIDTLLAERAEVCRSHDFRSMDQNREQLRAMSVEVTVTLIGGSV